VCKPRMLICYFSLGLCYSFHFRMLGVLGGFRVCKPRMLIVTVNDTENGDTVNSNSAILYISLFFFLAERLTLMPLCCLLLFLYNI
jgi:hypothetical protein